MNKKKRKHHPVKYTHAQRVAKAKCLQCLDTGWYYGGHYGAKRVTCSHPEKYQNK